MAEDPAGAAMCADSRVAAAKKGREGRHGREGESHEAAGDGRRPRSAGGNLLAPVSSAEVALAAGDRRGKRCSANGKLGDTQP